ncbi:hypothetical protein [Sphingomonas oryzagri]|uniref:UrcA family protein n=1 Tax=Sphingomonas oryzagri TaxID=3042314 RepID=A0ABT6N1C6_9SPHN|nr:hypothetical protein [Sphingomonas oryzagri]MDH7639100.1 hypothetical protein [Sphingomonas oryzagri]
MKKVLLALASAGTVIACAGVATAAQPGLSFATLEYQQPRDPLLPSNQSADIVEHTSADRLAPAQAAIAQAIPAGTSRATAEAVLIRAGAHCRAQGAAAERCSYFDVKTRDPYVDAVHWNVDLSLANDSVSGVQVNRTWVRDL